MSNIFTYPGNDANGAPIVFADFINDETKTKLLVLSNDTVALEARQYVTKMVEAHPQSFVFVAFLFIDEPPSVLTELKKLDAKLTDPAHTLNWDLYASYRVFSISPANKLISDTITAAQLNGAYGSIRSAIFSATENG